jgi:hypothetical protein
MESFGNSVQASLKIDKTSDLKELVGQPTILDKIRKEI